TLTDALPLARKVERDRDRGGDLVAMTCDDVDDALLRKTAAPHEMGECERACLMRNDEVDVVPRPTRSGKQPVDKSRKPARRQPEQFVSTHLEETAGRKALGLLVKVDGCAAGRQLAGVITLVMGLEADRPDMAAAPRLRRRQDDGGGAIAEQAGGCRIAMPRQRTRGDLGRNDEGTSVAARRDHRGRDIESRQEAQTGRVDVERRTA